VPATVLDASALLAYLRDEQVADVVADAIAAGAAVSTVNLAEVLSRAADGGAIQSASRGRWPTAGCSTALYRSSRSLPEIQWRLRAFVRALERRDCRLVIERVSHSRDGFTRRRSPLTPHGLGSSSRWS
jgi:uncharacterized protein with PIN domain